MHQHAVTMLPSYLIIVGLSLISNVLSQSGASCTGSQVLLKRASGVPARQKLLMRPDRVRAWRILQPAVALLWGLHALTGRQEVQLPRTRRRLQDSMRSSPTMWSHSVLHADPARHRLASSHAHDHVTLPMVCLTSLLWQFYVATVTQTLLLRPSMLAGARNV